MRALAGALLALAATLGLAGTAAAEDPTGYCVPENRQYDPPDLRPIAVHSDPRVRRSTVSALGISSPVVEAGRRRAREAVVFVHGNPGSGEDWLPMIAAAGRHGRALAFDLPGAGRAQHPWDFGYDMASYERWFNRVLRKLRVRRAHFVVHDIGGVLGMEWASHHPRRVESVVAVNSGVFLGYRHHHFSHVWRTPGLGEASMHQTDREGFAFMLNLHNSHRPLPAEFTDRLYDSWDRPGRCAVLRVYRSADDVEGDHARPQAERLRPHDIPALVVWGERDPFIPREMAARQREAFPSARIRYLADSGHWPFVDEPDRVRRLVTRFLRRQLRRP